LETGPVIFPGLGKFHENISKPWKKGGGIFQGLENWRRANLELMQERR
jgi:hypothetical protein